MAGKGEVLTIVEGAGGLRFDARIRDHVVATDQPVRAGGDDTAVSPLELLGAALGGCVALYVHRFCETRRLPVDGLRVEIRAVPAEGSPYRIGRFAIEVQLPAGIPDDVLPLIERVVRACPVHNTFAQPPEMTIDLQAPAAVA